MIGATIRLYYYYPDAIVACNVVQHFHSQPLDILDEQAPINLPELIISHLLFDN